MILYQHPQKTHSRSYATFCIEMQIKLLCSLLALLVCNAARGLACGLAGRLALAAAAVLFALAQIASVQCNNSFHTMLLKRFISLFIIDSFSIFVKVVCHFVICAKFRKPTKCIILPRRLHPRTYPPQVRCRGNAYVRSLRSRRTHKDRVHILQTPRQSLRPCR